MPGGRRAFIPALGLRVLNPLFDPVVHVTMREGLFKRRLVDQMRIETGQRVLDVGCGTGTLAVLIKQQHPLSEVVGLDPDDGILAIARRKAGLAGAEVRFETGYADRLPYPDASFDGITSSLVFHHLPTETKLRALREAFRVLRADGQLHIADFGRPGNVLMRIAALPVMLLDGVATTGDNIAGQLPILIAEAGFPDVVETDRFQTLFGHVYLYQASKGSPGVRYPVGGPAFPQSE